MKYPAKKGAFIIYIIIFLLLVSGIAMYDKHIKAFTPAINAGAIICFAVIAIFLWLWFDTFYVIKEEKLYYRSAFIRGSIPIAAIREVDKTSRGYVGMKASIALKGIVIKYNKWDELLISPLNTDELISCLKEINPAIEVKD
ncbi:PH domain-containing protein [Mucilaginibacter gotjawali]|uniref:Uncharacterized protein YyaB-like PH domain-containing protein n=1 Tax=Mucilaginibacter gotjawali TaxID=1550579 RepID=A0A839SNI2_9SPHI|nr:PH domain-containing protein [Mucilaginibacter gotjawali]MBB3058888.1 hypothetical protein [Mucilaginibacter gotjawali]